MSEFKKRNNPVCIPTWLLLLFSVLLFGSGCVIYIKLYLASWWGYSGDPEPTIYLIKKFILSGASLFVYVIIEQIVLILYTTIKHISRSKFRSNYIIPILIVIISFVSLEHKYDNIKTERKNEREYCIEIMNGEIPISSILRKESISNNELGCISSAVGKIDKIDQKTLAQLLELNLPVRGLANISLHKNSDEKTKSNAVSKILFSDRKNFEGGNPLASQRDNNNRITAYNPYVTEELIHRNALILESNNEWYNDKQCINFIFNIISVGVTSSKTLDFIVGKVNNALSLYVDGIISEFVKQSEMNYLLRDIYLHENISENTREKMLEFYNGNIDSEQKKRTIAKTTGKFINDIVSVYWATDEEIVKLIQFVLKMNNNGALIGYANGVSYYTGDPYNEINYEKVINKNILKEQTLVELAKQNPRTLRYSLSMINGKDDLSNIKFSLEKEINKLINNASSLRMVDKLNTNQKNTLSWIDEAVKYYSNLLTQIEQKIDAP
jgi:hypothetical protein